MDRMALKISISSVLIFFVSCASGTISEGYFEEVPVRIEQGQQDQITAEILAQADSIDPELRPSAIDTLDQIDTESARNVLIALYGNENFTTDELKPRILKALLDYNNETAAAFIAMQVEAEPSLFTPQIADYMLARNNRASAVFLKRIASKDKSVLNGRLASLFGETRLAEAIPLLEYMGDNNIDVREVFDALTQIDDPAAQSYIIKVASSPGHPAREEAIRSIPEIPDSQTAGTVLSSIVYNRSQEKDETVLLAIRSLGNLPSNEENYRLLFQLFKDTTDAQIRAACVISMAKMRGIEPEAMLEELAAIEEAGSEQKEEKKPVAEKEEKPVKKTTRPVRRPVRKAAVKTEQKVQVKESKERNARYSAAQSARYLGKVNNQFGFAFGPEAADVRGRVHNALLTYASSSSSSAGFVHRSYRKYYGISTEEARELLKDGLKAPGSLNALVRNVIAEYGNEKMQAYALSRFLAVKRWQAVAIIQMYTRGGLGK